MHRYSDVEVMRVLKDSGIVQSAWVSPVGRFSLFVATIVISALVGIAFQLWVIGEGGPGTSALPNGAQIATASIAAVAAVFAYYQWADARREASLEKFYERLRLTNDRYDSWPDARALVGHFWDAAEDRPGFERRMYTFLELDNLEYMILRYELGFVRKRLIWRAIRTYASRCESAAFRRLAVALAGGSGYDPKTKRITDLLAAMADIRQGTVR